MRRYINWMKSLWDAYGQPTAQGLQQLLYESEDKRSQIEADNAHLRGHCFSLDHQNSNLLRCVSELQGNLASLTEQHSALGQENQQLSRRLHNAERRDSDIRDENEIMLEHIHWQERVRLPQLEKELEFCRKKLVRDKETRDKIEAAAEAAKKEMEAKIDGLEKQISEESFGGSYSDSSATPTMFEAALAQANEAMQNLASGIDPRGPAAAGAAEGVRFARRIHRRFAVRAVLCGVFFAGFEGESFGSWETEVLDPEEQRRVFFREFLRMERDLREFRSEDYDLWKREKMVALKQQGLDGFDEAKFEKVAASVWKLHRLAFSFYPAARILRVAKKRKFEAAFMESVMTDEDVDDDGGEDALGIGETVAFMVSPGFTIRKTVFKSQVYPVLEKKARSVGEVEADTANKGWTFGSFVEDSLPKDLQMPKVAQL